MVFKNANRNAAFLYSHRSITRNNFVSAGNCTCHDHTNVLTTTKRFTCVTRIMHAACGLLARRLFVVFFTAKHKKVFQASDNYIWHPFWILLWMCLRTSEKTDLKSFSVSYSVLTWYTVWQTILKYRLRGGQKRTAYRNVVYSAFVC